MTAVTPDESSADAHVLREQVRLIYRQSKTGIFGNNLVAIACVLVGWRSGVPLGSLLPLFLVLVVYGARLILLLHFLRDEGRHSVVFWWRAGLCGSLAAGLAWGLADMTLFPSAPQALRVFLLIVGGGLTAAGMATLAPVRAAFLSYLIPFIGGLSIATALYFPSFPWLMAGILLVYMVVMVRASKEQADVIAQSLRLAFENQTLITALVTARERAEQDRAIAEAANQAKSQFLARMSHEIRTPLNGVTGVHELLLTAPLGPEERRFVETAHQCGQALLSIINDVLDFSKIEAGKVTLETAPFKVERLLEELMALFSIAAHRKGLLLSYELDEALPSQVQGDELRLRQVLTNLIGNAIKFTATGEVTVSVRGTADGRVRFGVKDSGPGVDVHQRGKIFEPFEQADGSITRRFGGTGLGLAISRNLVELMGGTLDVESELGRGSEFFFTTTLPKAPDGEPWPRRGAGLRAGVWMSHRRSGAAVSRWLLAAGFQVVEPEGSRALDGLGLLVLDEDLTAELDQAREAGIPTVVCEQTLSLGAWREGGHGAVTRVARPLQRSKLLAAVDQLLHREAPALGDGAQTPAGPRARVLVVDDDAVNRTIAQAMLKRLGCDALLVSGGQAALDTLASEHFDLVLMDCEMPDLDGLTVTREVRRRERAQASHRLPVVALTGHATEVQRQLCLAAEMDEMLTKPISLATLAGCLERWVPTPEAVKPAGAAA